MGKLITYHGTSAKNAKKIIKEGFKAFGVKRNWKVPSKEGFVYFSSSYSPFYAQHTSGNGDLAIIKVEIDDDDLYPEDDAIMSLAGKPSYTQSELDDVDFEMNKVFAKKCIEVMGNCSAKPDKIKILGVAFFSGEHLISKCDPVICQKNFLIMGGYYLALTEHIFAGNPILDFAGFDEYIRSLSKKQMGIDYYEDN